MACSACSLTLASSDSSLSSHPPVSTMVNRRPRHSASTVLRSRVTPGCSSTIVSRRPSMRLTRVDLPTLGRPTTATTGGATTAQPRDGAAQGHAVGGDDLDRARQVGRHACRRGTHRWTGRRRAGGSGHPAGSEASVRATSAPTRSPVTAMLPPKNSLRTGTTRTSSRPSRGEQRREHARAVLAREDGDGRGRLPARGAADGRLVVASAAPGSPRRRAVDPCEEPGLHADGLVDLAEQLGLEGARHADAVLVHGEALVGLGRREGTTGQQVVLVGGERQAPAEHAAEHRLRTPRRCRRPPPPRRGCAAAWPASCECRLTPSGTTHSDASSGYSSSTPVSVSSSTAPSLTPGHTTTWPCTSMPWSSRARSQRRLVAPRRLRSILARTSGSVAWMLTLSGLSRSLTTRSRSSSVKRVSVVKFP